MNSSLPQCINMWLYGYASFVFMYSNCITSAIVLYKLCGIVAQFVRDIRTICTEYPHNLFSYARQKKVGIIIKQDSLVYPCLYATIFMPA